MIKIYENKNKKNAMKKTPLTFLILLCCVQLAFTQSGSNAVRLNPSTEIVNTIFWNNSNFPPTSPGVVVSHSASDSLTAGTNNIQLFSTPFVSGSHRVNSSSPVYNAGRNAFLGSGDVLDLDHNSRVSCDSVDMGAYEYQVERTTITRQPQNIHFCEGTPAQISVTVQGEALTYQWQRLVGSQWENIPGERQNFLIFQGNSSETGEYRVFVVGACCSDTSEIAQVTFDIDPSTALVVASDTTIVSGASVNLSDLVISSIGTIHWYESDLQTLVLNPLIPNITESKQFVAIAQNGACVSNEAMAEVWIIIGGMPCVIRTRPDTLICNGDSYRLILEEALVEYSWVMINADQTTTPIPNFALVRPTETTRFVAFGENEMGHTCSDTLTITVHTVSFNVMPDRSICYWENVLLWSVPPATDWCYADGSGCIGGGNRENFSVLANQTTTLIAKLFDGTCEVSRTVRIHSNPPDLKVFPSDTIVCEGASIQLGSNVDPSLIKWRQKISLADPSGTGTEITNWDPLTQAGPLLENLTPGTYFFEAENWDILCGTVYDVVTVVVRAKPVFNISSQPEVCQGSPITLMAEPNATYWTLLDGTRVFNPITMVANNTFIGWYDDDICKVSDTIDITVVSPPTLVVSRDTTIVKGNIVQLWSIPETAHWTELPNTFLGQGTQFVSPTNDTTVYVAELSHICGVFRDTVRIYVLDEEISIDDFNVRVEYGFGCFENTGWATVIISGGVTTHPFRFSWIHNGTVSSSTDSARTNLPSGTHTVVVRDNVDSIVVAEFTLTLAPPIHITFSVVEPTNEACSGGRISTTIFGGTPPYSYWWDDNHNIDEPDRFNMDAGTYILTVTDSRNCSQKISIPLNCLFRRVMPTLFISPNNDGHNDILKIQYIERYPINRVIILNSYGAQIRVFRNYDNETVVWDGRNERGQVLPDGVYYYIIEAQGLDQMVGWVLMKASKN